jgi:BMFP domain-containing protein YqiC
LYQIYFIAYTMDSTKNFFDAWMNTQSKIVGNLMDTSKKFQESLGKNEIVEKSVDLYNNLLEKQKSLVDSMMGNLHEKVGKEKAGDFIREWMDSQLKLGQKWLGMLTNPQAGASDNFTDRIDHLDKLYGDWTKVYTQFFNNIGKPLEMPFLSNPFQNNSFSNLIKNTQTYMKMFELWQPIYKLTQSNTIGLDSLGKVMDMDRYREVMDNVFQFMTPEKSQNFLEQIKKYNEIMLESMGGMKGFFGDSFNQVQKLLPHGIFDKNLGSLAQVTGQLNDHFQKIINPYFTMIPAGREKDIAGVVVQVQELLAKYYIKATEMQNIVYATGQHAMEKSVREVMKQAQEKSEMISFDHFFSIWVEVMESDMIALFASETFVKALGELTRLALELKAKLDKQMEQMLAAVPLVPRSEMDEVNATIYDLRTKIRHLETKLKELDEHKGKLNQETQPVVAVVETPVKVVEKVEKTTTPKKTTAKTKKASE